MTNQPPPLPGVTRPRGVVLLMVLYWLVTPVVLFSWMILTFSASSGREGALTWLDLSILATDWILRGIGITRLFMMKANAWLYLLVAFCIYVSYTLMNIIERFATNRIRNDELLLTASSNVMGFVVLAAVVVYAYHVCHSANATHG